MTLEYAPESRPERALNNLALALEKQGGEIARLRGELNRLTAEREQQVGALSQQLHQTQMALELYRNRRVVRWVDRLKGWLKPAPPQPTAAVAAQPAAVAVATDVTDRTDIIVCVHNALDDVQRCLRSVLQHTTPVYRLIVVDDGSAAPTRDWLARFCSSQSITLIRNEQAGGYTLAANQGMRASQGRYVVLLNSDTLVSAGWLERLHFAAEVRGERTGIVGPLSNTASWQSIPEIEHEGDWATNPLPDGVQLAQWSDWVALRSGRIYPILPFLNGFCLLIKRSLIDTIGYFDEEHFGRGYGEENDYCLRAQAAGFQLVLADDCYVYHAQSKSYSHERRKPLAEAAGQALVAKHGAPVIEAGVAVCRDGLALLGLRQRARRLLERQRQVETARARWEGRRVLIILPVQHAGGGANIVLAEALALQEMGVDVRLVNQYINRSAFERSYPDLHLPVIYIDSEDELLVHARHADAVVATVYYSAYWVKRLGELLPHLTLGYYIQDYEPYFFPEGSPDYVRARQSYQLDPRIKLFTKTCWNRDELQKQTNMVAQTLGIDFDADLYRPGQRHLPHYPHGPVRICAMVRPTSPRRSPMLTMRVLRAISQRFGAAVEIVIFGVAHDDPALATYPTDFDFNCHGVCDRLTLVRLFREVDIFADFSSFQAMGLTALEAMGCGAAVLVPQAGGAGEFARDHHNALLVDTSDEDACIAALARIVEDHALRQRLQRQAVIDVAGLDPTGPAYRMLEVLFGEEAAR
ncbi:glycosyltransferase [Chitinimonas lacunae]|uniref:Glycosyltransferase n=1 Tax=Chitinimonas lacunae TaxID=1963018 RepID=A0ABV8MX05_9NEIS